VLTATSCNLQLHISEVLTVFAKWLVTGGVLAVCVTWFHLPTVCVLQN
jgi:hypothetical protein